MDVIESRCHFRRMPKLAKVLRNFGQSDPRRVNDAPRGSSFAGEARSAMADGLLIIAVGAAAIGLFLLVRDLAERAGGQTRVRSDSPRNPRRTRLGTVSSSTRFSMSDLEGRVGIGAMELCALRPTYRSARIPKRGIGPPRWRELLVPDDATKRVQRRILHRLLDRIPVHTAAHGFERGRPASITKPQLRGWQAYELMLAASPSGGAPMHHNRTEGPSSTSS